MAQLYSRRTIPCVSKRTASAALFAIVWLCYAPGNLGCADSMWSIPTAVSLLDHGDADLDEYLPMLRESLHAWLLQTECIQRRGARRRSHQLESQRGRNGCGDGPPSPELAVTVR